MCHRVRISSFRSAFALILAFVLIGTAADVYAGAGEPGGAASNERIVGPTIEGVITITCCTQNQALQDVYTLVFVGSCRQVGGQNDRLAVGFTKQKVTTPAVFQAFTEQDWLYKREPQAGPPGCHSVNGGEEVIISGIQKFNNTGTMIGFDAQISFIELK